MNKVFLIGNLTRDPELGETPNGISLCRFSIAVNRAYTSSDSEKQTDYFNCTAWRGLGERVARYCKKGSKVSVVGSIQIRQYEGNDGLKRNAVDIIAQDVEFLNSSARNDRNGSEEEGGTQRQMASRKPVQRQMEVFDDDGDIPF